MNPGLILCHNKSKSRLLEISTSIKRNAARMALSGASDRTGIISTADWQGRKVLMVADSERRDAEICVKLVMPFRGLCGFISGQSHSPTPYTLMPWDSRGESTMNTLHTHTHIQLLQLESCARHYDTEQSMKRHTVYSAMFVNVHACGMILFPSQSFTPPVWEQVCDCEERWDLTQPKWKIVGKTVGLPVSVLFNSRQQEQDLRESCQNTH